MSRQDILQRSIIFVAVALLLWHVMARTHRLPNDHSGGIVVDNGQVALMWLGTNVEVTVDERTETVPLSQLNNSAIYQKALLRLPADFRPPRTELRWTRVSRLWFPACMLAWWIIFRFWKPTPEASDGERFRRRG